MGCSGDCPPSNRSPPAGERVLRSASDNWASVASGSPAPDTGLTVAASVVGFHSIFKRIYCDLPIITG